MLLKASRNFWASETLWVIHKTFIQLLHMIHKDPYENSNSVSKSVLPVQEATVRISSQMFSHLQQ